MENNIISEIGTDSSSILSYDGIKVGGSISTIKEKVDLDELELFKMTIPTYQSLYIGMIRIKL